MGTGGTARFVAPVLVLAALCAPAASLRAQERQRDLELPGCGICYPGGYDLNTVGSIRGTVMGLQFPDEGPVRFTVDGGGERWVVLASPAWHVRTTGLRLSVGDSVAVRGSKTLGSDGILYLVAQQIRIVGAEEAAVIRDGRGRPLWGGGHREGGNQRGGRKGGRWATSGTCRP